MKAMEGQNINEWRSCDSKPIKPGGKRMYIR